MDHETSNIDNRRIAKNTLYMYVRMFIILGVTLYTSRVIIRTLGIDDYGIYNIVGGIVILFSFINISLKNAFQRFISYELGRNDGGNVYNVIGASLQIVLLFSIVFLIIAESVGLWFVYNKLNIPADRLTAAIWVYHFSIITFIINLIQTPFQATVVSYERFSFYAAYSIIDALIKLVIAFFIAAFHGDKLILYGGLVVLTNFVNLIVIAIYTNRYLKIPYRVQTERTKFRLIFSYSGWSMMNSSTVIVAQQGGNILLNLFSGVVANGAYGIANQVSAAVNGFVANFQSAFNPQIVKSYAAKEYESMYRLINRSCLFSFYLLLIIAIPFFLECDYILELWLGTNPQFASGFCRLMLIYFLIDAAQAPLWMLINATGNVKVYQIWSGLITILNLPFAAILLYHGLSVYWVFIVRVSLNFICAVIRPLYLKHLVHEFSLKQYLEYCIIPIIKTLTGIAVMIVAISILFQLPPIIEILMGIMITIVSIWSIGITKSDRSIIVKLIKARCIR